MLWPENYTKRSQDLQEVFHDAGQFYWFKSEAIINQKRLFLENSGYILLKNHQAHDIDTLDDWRIAEQKYNYKL